MILPDPHSSSAHGKNGLPVAGCSAAAVKNPKPFEAIYEKKRIKVKMSIPS